MGGFGAHPSSSAPGGRGLRGLAAASLALLLLIPMSPAGAAAPAGERPRIGLVLAGGGAKGIAHVGVIKVLEEAGVDVDLVAGTSMGAIVGSLYAMGYPAVELERIVDGIDWDSLFIDDTPRQERSIRRKTDDIGFLAEPRLRFKEGEMRLPPAAIRGQRLTVELSRLLQPVSGIGSFDELPRPFRAVATDLETGEEVVLGAGDLGRAVRASMSFPGAFPPVEIDGRVLVDGGVVNNIPVDIVRGMGADIVIVSTFEETRVPARELKSAPAIVARVMDILMQTSRREQIESLGPDDILITTRLGDIGAGSFDRAKDTLGPGEAAARAQLARLVALARRDASPPRQVADRFESRPITSITIETDVPISTEVIRARMRTREGDPFDRDRIEADLRRIYGLELFETVTYDADLAADGVRVHIVAKERTAGRNYLRFGLNLQTDLGRESAYDAGLSYMIPAINALNGELRAEGVFGDRLGAGLEIYQPLDPAAFKFIRTGVRVLDRDVSLFQDNRKVAEGRVLDATWTFDAGLNLSDDLAVFGSLARGFGRVREVTGTGALPEGGFDTASVGAGAVYDTLDNLDFPRSGAIVVAKYAWSPEALGASEDFQTVTLSANVAGSIDRHTLVLGQTAQLTVDGETDASNRFELGGPLRLSGLLRNALSGDNALLSRAIYYYELGRIGPSLLAMPFYVGGSVEYGNVFEETDDIGFGDMLVGGSLFFGMRTYLGPLFLGYGQTEGGEQAAFLLVGGVF